VDARRQLNTDGNMRLQYLAGMSLNSYVETDILAGITRYYSFRKNYSPARISDGMR